MATVTVEQYNPQWPQIFDNLKAELESYLEGVQYISIEHVGSTSVPGLAAKPIIDIDIIVSRDNVQAACDALVTKGQFTNMGELGIIDRHCVKSPNQTPPRNIYVCVDGAFQLRNHLAVRDTLRKNPALREEYGNVKLELAAKGILIVDYIEAKSGIIQKILKEAGLLTAEELAAIDYRNKPEERFGAKQTERLMLREFVFSDGAAMFTLESNEEVVRYQTYPPRSKEQAQEEVIQIMKNSCVVPRKHYELAVVQEGKFIGRVGANLKLENENGDALPVPHADLWFALMPELQGKGFATEAMTEFIGLLKKPITLEIECDPRNVASWKVAEKLGFEKVSLTERAFESKGEWVDSLVYRKAV